MIAIGSASINAPNSQEKPVLLEHTILEKILTKNMIPIKDKKYMINCQGPYDYNRYIGEGVYLGKVREYFIEDVGNALSYGFKICFSGRRTRQRNE